jgi:hypothetical protein
MAERLIRDLGDIEQRVVRVFGVGEEASEEGWIADLKRCG